MKNEQFTFFSVLLDGFDGVGAVFLFFVRQVYEYLQFVCDGVALSDDQILHPLLVLLVLESQ